MDRSGSVSHPLCQSTPILSNGVKRKFVDDSGYDSIQKSGLGGSSPVLLERDIYKPKVICRKRLMVENLSCDHTETYEDFLGHETSLYNELCDISPKAVDSGVEDTGLELSEERKVSINIDLCRALDKKITLKREKKASPKKPRIGRSRTLKSLEGCPTVDIMYCLGEKSNHSVVVSNILSYLSDEDISNATMVSKTWYKVVLRDRKAFARWSQYTSHRKIVKENLFVQVRTNQVRATPFSILNMNSPSTKRLASPRSPPVSPSKVRFRMFQKEAENLKADEFLMQCPRCQRPSICSQSRKYGQCKCIRCQMKFCTNCLCDYHESRPCPGFPSQVNADSPRKKSAAICSKQSRRNLRRL